MPATCKDLMSDKEDEQVACLIAKDEKEVSISNLSHKEFT